MSETAILAPLTSSEIVDIACDEFRKRLVNLGPLQGCKEYAGFSIYFEHRISLYRVGSNGGGEKQTLAWGAAGAGDRQGELETVADKGEYKSDPDVNGEREKHDLPLSVESKDGKGNRTIRKVRVKPDGKK